MMQMHHFASRCGVFFEVGASGGMLWKYVNPVTAAGPVTQGTQPNGNLVFKIRRYAPDYPGLVGRNLAPQGTVELHDQTVPPPVAAGDLIGGAARFSKSASFPGQIDVTYDPEPCAGSEAVIVHGAIGNFTGYTGCAQAHAGSGGTATIDAGGLDNVWFNILWTTGATAGHPGFGFDGVAHVAETWTAAGWCGLTADDLSRSACP